LKIFAKCCDGWRRKEKKLKPLAGEAFRPDFLRKVMQESFGFLSEPFFEFLFDITRVNGAAWVNVLEVKYQ